VQLVIDRFGRFVQFEGPVSPIGLEVRRCRVLAETRHVLSTGRNVAQLPLGDGRVDTSAVFVVVGRCLFAWCVFVLAAAVLASPSSKADATTTTKLRRDGISITLSKGWHGRIHRRAGGLPIVLQFGRRTVSTSALKSANTVIEQLRVAQRR
jgi:hypothetical protein